MKKSRCPFPSQKPNEHLILEVPDDVDETLEDNKSQLSVEERMALLDEFTVKFMEFVGPDFQPLSDYAMSREGIYEDHP